MNQKLELINRKAFGSVVRPFRFSIICTFIWGLIAHAYAYFSNAFSHDSLTVYAALGEEKWKIELGRYLVPFYRILTRGGIEMPWLIGLLALLWLGLSVFLIVRMFNIRSHWGIILLSGLMVTNVTVSTVTASFLYELDFDMLSILLAVLAVYFWKYKKLGICFGSLCVFAVLGIYQCNICVTIVLIMMDCTISFLRCEDTRETVKRGLLGVVMLLIGAVLYIIALRVILFLANHIMATDLPDSYNSITNAIAPKTNSLPGLLTGTYTSTARTLLLPDYRIDYGFVPIYTVLTPLLLVVSFVLIICVISRFRPKRLNLMLAILLIGLLPLGSNISYILNDGIVHDLMKYAVWLTLAFPILLYHSVAEIDNDPDSKKTFLFRYAASALLCVLLFQNILLSNGLYLKKDLEHEATLSFMTRVMDDIYDVDGYEAGTTELCFIGTPEFHGKMQGFESLYNLHGNENPSSIPFSFAFNNYFKFILNLPYNLSSLEDQKKLAATDEVQAMPCYPADGSIRWVGDILVVKMS